MIFELTNEVTFDISFRRNREIAFPKNHSLFFDKIFQNFFYKMMIEARLMSDDIVDKVYRKNEPTLITRIKEEGGLKSPFSANLWLSIEKYSYGNLITNAYKISTK